MYSDSQVMDMKSPINRAAGTLEISKLDMKDEGFWSVANCVAMVMTDIEACASPAGESPSILLS